MKWVRQYRFSLEGWGLLAFLLVMVPNFIWFAVPAPNDVLRRDSVTPILDGIASVCQVLFAAALCLAANRKRERLRLTPLISAAIACGALYYTAWILYYLGIVNPAVILLLTVPPCLCFLFFALDRKNYIAAVPAAVFAVCHLLCSYMNFII